MLIILSKLFGVKLNHFNCNIEVSKDESIDDDDHEEKDDEEKFKHIPIVSKN